MSGPPSSSFVISVPVAARTTGGPPGNTWAFCVVITLKWASTACRAGSPATDPSTADTTGTVLSRCTSVCVKLLASGR